jgi:hypothetical protein
MEFSQAWEAQEEAASAQAADAAQRVSYAEFIAKRLMLRSPFLFGGCGIF